MYNLRTIALKLFRAGKTQAITSIITVAIAIALVVIICTYGFSAKAKLEADKYELYGDSDIEFGFEMEEDSYLDGRLLKKVEGISEVKAVSPILLNPNVNVEGVSINLLGVNNDELTKSRLHFSRNIHQNEIIMSERLLQSLEKSIGDQLLIEHKKFTIVDTFPLNELNAAYIPHVNMKEIYPYMLEGKFALVQTISGLEEEVGTMIAKMDDRLRVDLLNESEFMQKNIESLLVFIIVLTIFVLLITGTLLLSNFRLIFNKLQIQFMRLRAIGATMKQIGIIVLIQLTTIIVTGIVFGTLIGITMMKFGLNGIIQLLDLPPVETTIPIMTVVGIALLSFVILQLFVLRQVWIYSKVLPMQMKQQEKRIVWTKNKSIVSVGIAIIAIILLFIGFTDNSPLKSLFGTAMLTIQLIYLLPYVFQLLLKHSLLFFKKLFGKSMYLALQQLIPQVRKNKSTILTIISVMVILVFSTATMKSIAASGQNYIEEQFQTEVIGTYDLADIAGEQTLAMLADLKELEGVRDAYAYSTISSLKVQLPDQMVYADIRATNFSQLDTMQFTTGMIVKESFAEKYQINIGDKLPIIDINNNSHYEPLVVQAISNDENTFRYNDIIVDWSSPIADFLALDEIFVDADSTDILQPIINKKPALHFTTKTMALMEEEKMYKQRFVLIISSLMILVAASTFGVLQTLSNAILRQQRDYRIKRLLGLTQNGMVFVIVLQSLTFILYGLIFGLAFGIFFTKLLWFSLDPAAQTLIDIAAILFIVFVILLLTFGLFAIQGYMMSRHPLQRLAKD